MEAHVSASVQPSETPRLASTHSARLIRAAPGLHSLQQCANTRVFERSVEDETYLKHSQGLNAVKIKARFRRKLYSAMSGIIPSKPSELWGASPVPWGHGEIR